ncbi:MAG: T9SS type A sorting domain-containing protein [Chitinophagales bacterium]
MYSNNYIEEYKANLTDYKANKQLYLAQNNGHKSSNTAKNSIAINVHIIRDDNGVSNIDTATISQGINFMNKVFEDAGIEFYVCGNYNYINSTLFYNMHNGLYDSVYNTHGIPNTINLFFARYIIHYGSMAAGVAPTPGGGDWIILRNNVDSAVFAHEMGHFFGLLHTHGLLYDVLGNTYTEEYVDGSNCSETADYFCDTPADPGMHSTYGISVDTACQYIRTNKDMHYQVYTPDVHNLMSYAPNKCLTHFSAEQSDFMLWNYLNRRNYLTCSTIHIDFNYQNLVSCDSPYVYNFQSQNIGLSNLSWDVNNDGTTDYTGANITHAFAQPGIYWITLKGTNNGKVYTRKKPVKITQAYQVPHLETMNNGIPADWYLENLDHGRKWELENVTGNNGANSLAWCFNNFDYTGYEEKDAFITKAYDLRNVENARLSFDIAYQPHINCDSFTIYISTDCGNNFATTILAISDTNLATTEKTYQKFIPSATDWKKLTINLDAFVGNFVSFKFENYNKNGNQLYIDNILVDGGTLSKEVGFEYSNIQVSETGKDGTLNCRKYTDYNIPLYISDVPTNNVNTTINATGSALNQIDFDILNPSITFLAGQNSVQYLQLRIFDDNASETQENIELKLSINGISDFDTSQQTNTCLVAINDNDPINPQDKLIATILLDENFDTMQADTLPGWQRIISDPMYSNTYWWSSSFWNSWIYDPNNHNFNNSLDSTNYMCISNYYSWNQVLCSTYLITPEINVSQFDSLHLEFDHWLRNVPLTAGDLIVEAWNGNTWINYLRHTKSDGNIGSNFHPKHAIFSLMGFNNSDFKIRIGIENEQEGFWYMMDNFKLTAFHKAKIATNLNETKTAYLGPNDLVHFYDESSGDIIASIQNNNSWNYGCTQIQIDREGMGALPYLINDASYYATEKTVLITPTYNTPTGEYDITLYYAQAEVDGWEQQTGESYTNLSLTKTGGAIANISPTTPLANGNTNFEATSSLIQAYINLGNKVQGTFSQGFSGFAAAKASNNTTLPVEYLQELQGQNKGEMNELKWTTAIEINNDYFELERSDNGIDFNTIGKQKGKGNSNEATNYTYFDKTFIEGNNYYRLKQVDFDGAYSFSNIVVINNVNAYKNTVFAIYPNPASNSFTIALSENDEKLNIEISNTLGQIIYTDNIVEGKNNISTVDWTNGIYSIVFKDKTGILIGNKKVVISNEF